MFFGNLINKLRAVLILDVAVEHALRAPADPQALLRTSHRDVHQPPLLADCLVFFGFVPGVVREKAVLKAAEPDVRKLQAFGCMHRHHLNAVAHTLFVFIIGFQRSLRQKSVQGRHAVVNPRFKGRLLLVNAVFAAKTGGSVHHFAHVLKPDIVVGL